jgi:single-strand DNA-binding protein
MASYNKITLIGNLGRDPETREFQGRKVTNFSIAVNDSYTKSDGQKVERTQWFRVSFWGNTAEVAEKYLKQGDQVFVEGRLSTQEYQDKEGKTRTSLEVRGTQLTLLGSASGGISPQGSDSDNRVQEPQAPIQDSSSDDDLPF